MNKMNGKNKKVGCHCEENFSSTKQSSTPVSNQCFDYMCTIGRKVEDCRVGVSHLLAMTRNGRSLEKIFKKIFRDDFSFLFAEILGSCFASPRMTEKWICPRMTFSVLTLATLLSFSIISESRAAHEPGCFVENEYVYCYNAAGIQQKLGDWSGGSTSYKVTSYTTDGDKLVVTKKDGAIVEFTYDTSANTVTNQYVGTSQLGNTNFYTFDNNGNKLSRVNVHCNSYDSSGNCTAYRSTPANGEYTYDPTTGNETSRRCCASGATYDMSTGKCSNYSSVSDYTYDQNGKKTSDRTCSGSSNFDSDGKCTRYSSGTYYTYDQNGNQTSVRGCDSFDSDGKCTSYSYRSDSTYDQNGKKTSYRSCSSCDSDGNCSSYSDGNDYTYDQNGKKTGETYVYCYTSTNTCYMDVYSCNQNGSCFLTNQYKGLAYSTDGKLCNSANPPVCHDFDMDASHCSINDTDESCLVCKDGYGLKNGKCQYCGSVAQSCHWDDVGEFKADSCADSYLEKNNKCISAAQGCGAGYKDMGGFCNHVQWTPAEAAAVLTDDNNNSVTITFKK